MIISDGFNGTPSGFDNVCEDETNHTYPYVLHAEANAITKVARSNNSSDGATLYVTDSPCIECAKLIIQAGIKRVVFSKLYRLSDGLDLLREAGVECSLSTLTLKRKQSITNNNRMRIKHNSIIWYPLVISIAIVLGIVIGNYISTKIHTRQRPQDQCRAQPDPK